jgi:MFS family permease
MSAVKSLRKLLDNPLALSLYLPWFVFVMSRGLLIPVLPLYADEFNISYGLIGVILAGEAIGTMLGDIPAGVLIQRFGNRNTALMGMALAAISTILLFWAQTVFIVFILRLIAGVGRAMFTVSQHVFLASEIRIANRGRAIALYGGMMRIGSFAGPLIGGAFAATLGLRSTFLLFGVICAFAWLALAKYLHDIESVEVENAPSGNQLSRLVATVKEYYRIFAVAGTGQLLAQMLRAGRTALIPLFADDILGLNVAQIGLLIGLAAAVDMSLFYPAGLIMDRVGRKYAIVPTFLLQSVGMALVPLTTSFGTLLLAMMVMSVGNGLSAGTMMTLGSDLAPVDSRGEFLGVWRLIGDIGATGGPLAVGGIADLIALQSSALAVAGGGFLAAVIFALGVPETLRRRQRKESAEVVL